MVNPVQPCAMCNLVGVVGRCETKVKPACKCAECVDCGAPPGAAAKILSDQISQLHATRRHKHFAMVKDYRLTATNPNLALALTMSHPDQAIIIQVTNGFQHMMLETKTGGGKIEIALQIASLCSHRVRVVSTINGRIKLRQPVTLVVEPDGGVGSQKIYLGRGHEHTAVECNGISVQELR